MSGGDNFSMGGSSTGAMGNNTPGASYTTILACYYADGIIVGIDSLRYPPVRPEYRDYIKHVQVSPGLYVSGSGVVSHAEIVINSLIEHLYVCRKSMAQPDLLYQAQVHCHNLLKRGYNAEFIISGRSQNQCWLYLVDEKCIDIIEGADAIGTGSYYLEQRDPETRLTYLERWSRNMTLDEAREYIVQGIALATRKDDLSGGNIRILAIDSQGNEGKWKLEPVGGNSPSGCQYVDADDF